MDAKQHPFLVYTKFNLQLQSCNYQRMLNDEDYYLLFIILKKYLCISKLSLSSGWKAVTS